jgi:ribosomal protein S18 acetylase RimI-like enzyme
MAVAKNVSVRDCRESELDLIARFIHSAIDGSYTGVYPPRAIEFFKEFHSRDGIQNRSREGTILVAERDGQMVGTGALVDNEICGVFVDRSMRGQGLGSALMRELEARARAKGIREVVLSVSLPSKGFYEALRYEILQEAHLDVGEGQRLDYWKARKVLSQGV